MSDRIVSLQNPRVKEAAKLRDRKGRMTQGRFIIDGAREIGRAFAAGICFVEVYVCDEYLHEAASAIVDELDKAAVKLLAVSPSVFDKLAYGDRADGLIAVAETPQRGLDDLKLPPQAVVAVLAEVEKPGNIGSVIRSADAAGVSAVIVADGGTDLFNPNAIRASTGAIFSHSVVAATTEDTLAWLRQHKFAMLALRVDGATPYTDVRYDGATAIILGSESDGLGSAWHANDIAAISLPMQGSADSLNVSVAAAVVFYEALRQRRGNGRP